MSRFSRLTSRNNWIMLVLLKKQAIMNESRRFVCELLFWKNMTIISFFARSNLLFLHDLWSSSNQRFIVDDERASEFLLKINYWDDLLWEYACNVFCVLSRNVRCDLRDTIQIFSCRSFLWLFAVIIRSRLCEIWSEKYDTQFSHAEMVWDDSFSWSCLIISSLVFWLLSLNSATDVCSFLTCRATYVLLMRRLRQSHFIKLRAIHYLRTTQKRLK